MAYQAIRIAIADVAIARPDVDPDRASFTIALGAARDQIVKAAGVIATTAVDIIGVIGAQVLADQLRARRTRTAPKVVKRAISNYAPHTLPADDSADRVETPPSESTYSPARHRDNHRPSLS